MPDRFDVVYHMLSMRHNNRIRIKVATDDATPVPSVTELFEAAIWAEREVFDMYGVIFEGNPDLRRILTDYGFEGHPLRKDFPLTGLKEVRWDSEKMAVIYDGRSNYNRISAISILKVRGRVWRMFRSWATIKT